MHGFKGDYASRRVLGPPGRLGDKAPLFPKASWVRLGDAFETGQTRHINLEGFRFSTK
jgi:hypothetical protein